jgi:hypothetical protein
MKRVLLCGVLALAGCSKKPAAPAPLSNTTESPAATAPAQPNAAATTADDANANLDKTVARLTQALRKFAAENRRVPKSLDELVSAGYLPELPGAPAGKRFVFDDQLRVTLQPAK